MKAVGDTREDLDCELTGRESVTRKVKDIVDDLQLYPTIPLYLILCFLYG
ncbi:MAG: hypothetical protein Nk1A_4080 [Endomicrobiia bacterium]|nr:MAG: hypothetical protein Nk1A_4080 [Endomicrobiia bacterium]